MANVYLPGQGWQGATVVDNLASSVDSVGTAINSSGTGFMVWTQGTATPNLKDNNTDLGGSFIGYVAEFW